MPKHNLAEMWPFPGEEQVEQTGEEVGRAKEDLASLTEREINDFLDKVFGKSAEAGFESVGEIKNKVTKAALYERMSSGEMITPEEGRLVATELGKRSWQGILRRLEAGDAVVNFLTPGGELSVKNFNDNIFGPQVTDEIIAERQRLVSELLQKAGLEEVNADYRSTVARFPSEAGKQDASGRINDICRQVSERLSVFVKSKLVEAEKTGAFDAPEKQKKAESLKNILDRFGFRMSFGLSEVKEAEQLGDDSNIVRALMESAQTSQLYRHGREGQAEYGGEYSETAVREEIKGVLDLKKELEQMPAIVGADNLVYEIFEEDDGRKRIGRDLLRAVRKNKLSVAPERQDDLDKIKAYVSRLNLPDIYKPFTADEFSGEKEVAGGKFTLDERAAEIDFLRTKAERGDLTDKETRRASEILSSDQKDWRRTSAEVFHQRALRINDCAYVSVDILDVGVDLLREYEELIEKAAAAKDPQEVFLRAGDETTERLRQARAAVGEVYGKIYGKKAAGEMLMLVGGDEMTLALEAGDEKKLDQLLIELRRRVDGRVVKTAVGASERSSSSDWSEDDPKETDRRVREHLAALKRAERGAELCKIIEEQKRNLEMFLVQRFVSKGETPAKARRQADEVIEDLKLNDLAIKEKANGFMVLSGDYKELTVDMIKEAIVKVKIKHSE